MSWTTLKADIANWLGNRSDMDAEVVTCISLAEAEFNREIRSPEMITEATDTMVDGVLALPADFLGMKSLYLAYDNAGDLEKVPLSQKSLQQLQGDYPTVSTAIPTVPGYYAISGSDVIFGPTPDADYDITYTYYAKIPALGASQATNWLLDAHPDLYMAGALWHGSVILKAWDEVAYFRGETGRLIDAVRKAGVKQAMGASSIQIPSPVSFIYMPGVRV
jgi:hypothetical protein